MSRRKALVADPLRSLAGVMRDGFESKDYPIEERVAYEWYCRMCVAADCIDAEHERRMEQAWREGLMAPWDHLVEEHKKREQK